ncbi:ankyrin repeat-containing protein ITN1-like [Ziziphus jujuba]|uniref:Ankyrin repeat-containing protein ITN1-like n=1 Tax=Ziziphus jujuba TaxID=326968 RepID=A0ABM3IEN2_ZIZJJ|nr:ankyrin repeat-containing protein ITN1-like [Ziziphus jujuba]
MLKNRYILIMLEPIYEYGYNTADTRIELYVAALKGDWKAAEKVENDINRVITEKGETTLHIAALARKEQFVRKLVSKLNKEDLEKNNKIGNNALCYAAASGNVEIAKLLVKAGNEKLVNPDSGKKPLSMAATNEHGQMVRYLFHKTNSIQYWEEEEQAELFTTCIGMGLYDLAIDMLKSNPGLAKVRNKYDETALTVLARTPLTFVGNDESQSAGLLKSFLNLSCIKLPRFGKSRQYSQALDLVKMLCDYCLNNSDEENQSSATEVANLLFDAAEAGNVDILIKLMHFNPDLLWVKDTERGTIFHVAVENRHEDIFNLLFEFGAIKDLIAKHIPSNDNNLLHFAAKLPPQKKLNTVSGAALQMHRELLWYKEVEKIVPTPYRDLPNSKGETPRALFEKEHKELKAKGEKWMKDIAASSMLVATLVATVMFTAAVSVPGGFNNYNGVPILLDKKPKLFVIFTISDTVGLFSSTASTLIFLSIHTSRYADDDFLKFVPFMLMFGVTTLFIALTAMTITFSATFLLYYHHHGLAFISVIVGCVPLLYLLLIFPLLVDLLDAIRGPRFLFKPGKHLFH